MLWFECPNASISEEWTVLVPANGRQSAWATAGPTRVYTAQHAALLFPVAKSPPAGRARELPKGGGDRDRREGDRRRADRRYAERRIADRRRVDQFDPERLVERRHADRRRRDRRDGA